MIASKNVWSQDTKSPLTARFEVTLVAVVGAFVAYLFWGASRATCGLWIGVLLLFAILLFASYDCLRKYNERAAEIVSDNNTVA
jgi:hypothetical protein